MFGIKLETKVMRLHKIWVEKISSFFPDKDSVHDFDYYLLCFIINQFTLFAEVYHTFIHHTLDKHNF